MAAVTCELTWLRYLFKDLQVNFVTPAKLYCDNQATLHTAVNLMFHKRTKHIEMDCHAVREKTQSEHIAAAFTSSQTQVADLLTKPLGKTIFHTHLRKLGITYIHAPT
ncbi:hypothetical protein PanWU01x14_252710 [Parasponia andersonii]|uniref:Uncharacterized protein n=1 Tax=Parasponia andersonii TaxID=3476 RepID=A0A2P5BBU6_PARAD|nr:hypothetical protein PanWU01x14_252710 [Parasponia andersonii]